MQGKDSAAGKDGRTSTIYVLLYITHEEEFFQALAGISPILAASALPT
jgi:hypothetical protein